MTALPLIGTETNRVKYFKKSRRRFFHRTRRSGQFLDPQGRSSFFSADCETGLRKYLFLFFSDN